MAATRPEDTNSSDTQRHEFQAETKRLLELMIHSLYSNKDIFLRELISNASDALDKLRFAALTDQSLTPGDDLHIRIEIDADERVLTLHDNGIGMSADEVVKNLGTIAKSGTQEFLALLKKGEDLSNRPELIGQFGVGFYSSFLVSDRVTVITRKAGETEATRWESDGVGGSYTVAPDARDNQGTSVTLKLKAADDEDGLQDYTSQWVIESLVRKYSDFVAYPIKMEVDKLGAKEDDDKPQREDKTLNSMKAIWRRPASEVSDSEYTEFYKHISHDWNDFMLRVNTKMEGTMEATALLFIPARAPFDIYRPDARRRGVQLYVKRVFIMDECDELLPNYLRFVKGVVDSEDLPLNVSREILQQNRQIRAIRKHLVKKVLDALVALKRDDEDKYLTFWEQFGPVLKEGLLFSQERNDRVYDLVLTESTTTDSGKRTSLEDYCERMGENQEAIYYLNCASAELGRKSPHIEGFRDKGVEVLFFSDHVDEIWLQEQAEYKEKKFRSVVQGDIQLGSEEDKSKAEEAKKQKQSELGDLLLAIRAALQEEVKEVRLSNRLTSSAACLVTDDGAMSPQLERLMRASGQDVPKTKRVLEINPDHPVTAKMAEMFAKSSADPEIGNFARLLFGQATLAEGGELEDPSAFTQLVADLMVKAAK